MSCQNMQCQHQLCTGKEIQANHNPLDRKKTEKLRNVFKKIKFSNCNFSAIIQANSKETVLNNFYPEEKILGTLAQATYENLQELQKLLPDDWTLLTTANNQKDGYSGAVYWNHSNSQIVIAHRGTILKNIGAVLTDLSGIIRNQYTSQMDSACTFTAHVLQELKETKKSISITGHSLGGWLAQVTTFSTEYLMMGEQKFRIKNEADPAYHVHTVAFDSPGCLDMLTRLSDDYFLRYKYKAHNQISSLDITSFLSSPNLINTCNRHAGILYRIYPKITDEYINYNLVSHEMKGILKALGQDTKEILDWPLVSWPPGTEVRKSMPSFSLTKLLGLFKETPGLVYDKIFKLSNKEYKEFHKFANESNNFDPKLKTINICGIDLHYQVSELNEQVHKTSVFSEDELMFLESWKAIKDVNPKIINDFLAENGLDSFKIEDFFFEIRKGDKLIICNSTVINCTKCLFLNFPHINEIMKMKISAVPRALEAVCISKSKDYLDFNNVSQDSIKFEDIIGLQQFIKSARQILYISSENQDHFLEIQRIYSILQEIKCEKNNYTFLSWLQLLNLENTIGITEVFNTNYKICSLLILDCQQIIMQENDKELLQKLLRNKRKGNIPWEKIIIIHRDTDNLFKNFIIGIFNSDEYAVVKTHKFIWNNLNTETQYELILRNKIVFQEHSEKTCIKELVNIDELNDTTSKELNTIIDSDTLVKLMSNEEISVGRAPVYISDMEAAYTRVNQQISSANFTNTLLHGLNKSIVLFTGIESLETMSLQDTLISLLQFDEDTKGIQNHIDVIWQNTKSNRHILIVPYYYIDHDFKEFCHHNPNKTVYWVHWKENNFFLKQFYNPHFYVSRKFVYRDKLVIQSDIKEELGRLETTDFFIIQTTLGGSNRESSLGFGRAVNIKLVMSEEEARLAFQNSLKTNYRAIHWLIQETENLVWKQSHGDLNIIRKYINDENSKTLLLTEEEFLQKIHNNKALIMIDGPGNGKTTTLTKLSESRSSLNWVIRINFKDYKEYSIKKIYSENITVDMVVKFLSCFKSSGIITALDKNLLKYKLEHETKNKPLLLVFDGFDEIRDKKVKEKMILLLKFIKSKAVVWVSSRHHETERLQNALSTFDVHFKQFSFSEQKDFLEKFWNVWLNLILGPKRCTEIFETIYPGEELTQSEKFSQTLLEKAQEVIGKKNASFMEIPLQLRLLAEGYLEKFILFIENNSLVPDFSELSLLKIYLHFIAAKYNIYFREKTWLFESFNNVLQEWFKEPLIKRHRHLAFKEVFDDFHKKFLERKEPFSKVQEENIGDIDKKQLEELFRIGLIQSSNNNCYYEFIHASLAEYFSVELIMHFFKKPWHYLFSEIHQLLLTKVFLNHDFKNIRLFLNEHFKEQLTSESLTISGKEILKYWQENRQYFFNEYNQTAFHIVVKENHTNILNFLLGSLKLNFLEKEVSELLSVRDHYKETFLFVSVKNNNDEIIEKVLCFIESCESSDLFKQKLVLASIFRRAEDSSNIVLKKLLKYVEKFPKLKAICDKVKQKYQLINDFFDFIRNGNLCKIKRFLNDADEQFHNYLLLTVSSEDETVLHLAVKTKKWKIFEYFVDKLPSTELGIVLKAKDDNNKSVIDLIINNDDWNPNIICNLITHILNKVPISDKELIVGTKNKDGLTLLYLLADNDKWEFVKQFISAVPEKDRSKVINIQNNSGWSVVHLAAQRAKVEDIDYLIKNGANVLALGKTTPLHEATLNENEGVVTLILEEINKIKGSDLSMYINATDPQGDTPLMWATQKRNIPAMRALLADTAIDLTIKNINGRTAFDFFEEDIEIKHTMEFTCKIDPELN